MLTRFGVFVCDEDKVDWRFNACFGGSDACVRAVEEADWYVSRGYKVAVLPVPDDVRKYTWHMLFTTDMRAVCEELARVVQRNTDLVAMNTRLMRELELAGRPCK